MIRGHFIDLAGGHRTGVAADESSVVAIGNFDGVHAGHQALVKILLDRADMRNAIAVTVLFEPHPREFFLKNDPPPRIDLLRDKLSKLQALGVPYVYILGFDEKLASMSPQDFIEQFLKSTLRVTEVIGGEDFRFGHARAGNFADLENAGIKTNVVPVIMIDGQQVRSSLIRELLLQGKFQEAQKYLRASYSISGRVVHGAKQGRMLGFPTLNIALSRKIALSGVYLVKVHGLESDKEFHFGVANVGRRPTLNPLAHPLLEVYVLDYDGNAYQKRVRVEFIDRIRDEQKFASVEELKVQIQKDVNEAIKR